MKLISPIVILLFLYGASGLQDIFADCDNDSWHAFREEKCLKVVVDEFVSHDDAQQFCIDQFGDSTLIQVNSLEEQEFVTKLVFETYQVVDNVWLGAVRKTDSATDFVWDDQSELGFTWWADGSPSGDFAKNCTQLTSRLSKSGSGIARQNESLLVEDGQWTDAACSRRNLVVCQKPENWTFESLKDAVIKLQAQVAALEEFVGMVPGNPGNPKSCKEVERVGTNTIYEIYPFGADGRAVSVQCDFETDGGSWTIIQQRSSGPKEQFYLDWTNYEEGFGDVDGNYWIGLQAMHSLTSEGNQELRVELEDWEGNHNYTVYNTFSVGNDSQLYRLTVDGYSGDAGDSMTHNNGHPFSTRDKDNDGYVGESCALMRHGAWWYGACSNACLNGYYYPNSNPAETQGGLYWFHWKGDYYSLKSAQMKIRERTV